MIEVATSAAFLLASVYGAGHANAQTDASNQATTIPTAPISRTLTDPKKIEAIVRARYANTPILIEIARCESTFRQFTDKGEVVRGIANKYDVGIMQINEKYHADTAEKLGYDIYDIDGNLAFGEYLYKKYGSSAWTASKPCWGGSLASK